MDSFQFNSQTSLPLPRCEFCQGDHYSEECFYTHQDIGYRHYEGYLEPRFNQSWELSNQDNLWQQQGGWDQQFWSQNGSNPWESYTSSSFEEWNHRQEVNQWENFGNQYRWEERQDNWIQQDQSQDVSSQWESYAPPYLEEQLS